MSAVRAAAPRDEIADRVAALAWQGIAAALDATGFATFPLLDAGECAALFRLYDDDRLFRARVVMERHGFGRGAYKYFAAPLPGTVAALRRALYPRLAPIADLWHERLGIATRFPASLDEFLRRCHAAGQTKPTPLLLSYGAGDYNCLHQDLYGEHVFPLQATVLLAAPGRDFTGGEFVLVEQRPRLQSRASVVPLSRGDAVVFAVRHRPAEGRRGFHRVTMRHGVSPVASGERRTLGLIFHDAR